MSYWVSPSTQQRERRLSVSRIARAAARVLDRGGEGALSTRSVADELGVAPSSLYRHVRTKDHLLDLALDEVLARDLDRVTGGGLDAPHLLTRWFAHLTEHPWAAPAVLARTPLGPAYLRLADELCRALGDAGVPPRQVLARSYSLTALVAGLAIAHTHHRGAQRPEDGYPVDLGSAPHLAEAVAAAQVGWERTVRDSVTRLAGARRDR
ncbi:helix-turn-helix domain-containing protein [Nocardiopsis composta]|uniref:AcrR family transcriptional regulator n=1 Tax=Nocardiopsis composta TaxID=157465 RepID=A0A7W8VCG7_9ACTN|nr:helix-turn-helix domain-containing protein [Nocardiopsis composta]MBB5430913.1 AcrR family transcriptional regulator [Nocardiopsis composta]